MKPMAQLAMSLRGFAVRHYYLLTPVLLYLSFPSFDTPVLRMFPLFAWFALVPLLVFVRKQSPRDLFFYSFLTAILGVLLPLNWIGQFGSAVPGGPVIILLLLVPSLSVFFAAKIFLAELLSRRFGTLRFLIYPAVWIFIDWVQSIGYLAYPGNYLGYTQYPFITLMQTASLLGVLGVTFLIVLSNGLFADVFLAWRRGELSLHTLAGSGAITRLGLFALLFVALNIYGAFQLYERGAAHDRNLRVTLVQSCIDPWVDWNSNRLSYLEELKRHTTDALAEKPDFIVWSESATLELITYDSLNNRLNEFEQELLDFVRFCKRPFLTGEIGVVEKKRGLIPQLFPSNSAVLINEQGEVAQSYAKINLVPFGEWFPYEKALPFVSEIARSMGGSDFVPGDRPLLFNLDRGGGLKFGTLICYEGIFYRLCREYRTMGADFLVNITNDGWTHTYSGHMQHFAASVFRAVENGVWYVRAGNTGYTALIDPYGRVTSSMPILTNGHVTGDLDFSLNHRTVYTRCGDLILYAACVFLGALIALVIFEKARRITRGKGA